MALTKEQATMQPLIEELAQIAEQNAAGKAASTEELSSKRSLKAMSDKLESLTERLIDHGVDEKEIELVTEKLSSYAEILVPTATVTWDRETATVKLTALTAFATLGMLSEEQVTAVEQIKAGLAIRNTGGGERAPRQAQEEIPGRPTVVTITDPQGNQFSKQKGNVATTTANLKTRVTLYVKQTTGNEVPAETAKAILEVAKTVVEGGKDGITTAEIGGFVFTAIYDN